MVYKSLWDSNSEKKITATVFVHAMAHEIKALFPWLYKTNKLSWGGFKNSKGYIRLWIFVTMLNCRSDQKLQSSVWMLKAMVRSIYSSENGYF